MIVERSAEDPFERVSLEVTEDGATLGVLDSQVSLSPGMLRWLALIGAAQAYRLLPESVRAGAEGRIECERPVTHEAPESAPAEDTPEAQEAQAMLDEPLFQT